MEAEMHTALSWVSTLGCAWAQTLSCLQHLGAGRAAVQPG